MLYRHREAWAEEDLEGVQPGEYDFQEFKGTPWLEIDGEITGHFLPAYSKQLSAFANGGGGHLFIGLDDRGRVDGGVSTSLKSGGTRSWLEDVTGTLVDPPLPVFNVYEVRGGAGSPIRVSRAVYVVEIPASQAAPHQASDRRYYLRIAGKSRPMGHVHLQDVLRRTRHPSVHLTRLGPYGEPERDEHDPRGRKVHVSLRAFLNNAGPTLARHVGGELILPRALVNSVARERMLGYDGVNLTQRPGELVFFKYHPTPLFPTQETFFQRFWVTIHAGNLPLYRSGRAAVAWRVYADDAPPESGRELLTRFRVVRRSVAWVRAGR